MKAYSELKSLGFFEWLDDEHGVEEECVSCNEQKQVHSMCLDCCIKLGNQNQTEISDDEIEKIINPNKLEKIPESWKSFIDGAKWYREQLKKTFKQQ